MSKNKGWVRLWRDQFNHWVSERKPWCDGYAWSYLYAQANHKPGVVNFRNQYIQVERGQFITSKLKLQAIFGWSKKRTNSFLTSLEVQGMSTIRRTNRFIVITICNYEKYQSALGEEEPTEGSAEGPTESQQRAINKNDNKKELKIYCNSFETLSAFLSSLPETNTLSLEVKELITEFLNRIRSANTTKAITGGRVRELVARFLNIQERTDQDSLLSGLKAVFKKIDREGFDFSKRDPTGYVRTVAKSHRAREIEEDHSAGIEKDQGTLRNAEAGGSFSSFCDSITGKGD